MAIRRFNNPVKRQRVVAQSTVAEDADCLFVKVLDEYGVKYKTNKRSIIIETCPCCNKSWKVWMFRPSKENSGFTGGQCWRCGNRFSSASLLFKLGLDDYPSIVSRLNLDGLREVDYDSMSLPDFGVSSEVSTELSYVEEIDVPACLIPIDAWPEHRASKYAMSRGVLPPMTQYTFIEPMANAVAFPVLFDDLLVGFQRRYVTPTSDKFRIRSDPNIPKAHSFVDFGEEENPLCIVEGPFDAVAAAWFGLRGMATMGKDVSRYQAQQLCSLSVAAGHDTVYVAYDVDIEGERGARVLARYIDMYGLKIARLLPPKGFKDLNAYLEFAIKDKGFTTVERFELSRLRLLDGWRWDIPVLDGELSEFLEVRGSKRRTLNANLDNIERKLSMGDLNTKFFG